MNRSFLIKAGVFLCLYLSAILLANAGQQTIKAGHLASPEHYQVLLNNEHVLVLKMVLKPGQQDAMHHHHNETVYFQTGGKLLIKPLGGTPIEVNVPDGHVMWHEAWQHQVTNLGQHDVVAIIVEAKPDAQSSR